MHFLKSWVQIESDFQKMKIHDIYLEINIVN